MEPESPFKLKKRPKQRYHHQALLTSFRKQVTTCIWSLSIIKYDSSIIYLLKLSLHLMMYPTREPTSFSREMELTICCKVMPCSNFSALMNTVCFVKRCLVCLQRKEMSHLHFKLIKDLFTQKEPISSLSWLKQMIQIKQARHVKVKTLTTLKTR